MSSTARFWLTSCLQYSSSVSSFVPGRTDDEEGQSNQAEERSTDALQRLGFKVFGSARERLGEAS